MGSSTITRRWRRRLISKLRNRGSDEPPESGCSVSSYLVFVAENGDKLFSRNNVTVQRGSGKLTTAWSGWITGGTGKLSNVQGTTSLFANFDPSPGGAVTNTQIDIEYAIGK
jgi:hypothetical protein